MQVRRVGRDAVLVEIDAVAVPAWFAELRRRRDAGDLAFVEIVPGARTILLDGVPDPAALVRTLTLLPAPPLVSTVSSRVVVIPAVYDGPDLLDVARRWNATAEETVRIHSSTRFTVAFCGFTPGFAYLTGLPPRLRVPRHPAPRVRVPAGSVALAGPYTAVYPGESPGGWQLIGRTDLRLFDLACDPPARLSPGTTVCFRPVAG
ncbi:MAG: hypothetical protein V7603_4661 [Micromonosporaceae bacterium]